MALGHVCRGRYATQFVLELQQSSRFRNRKRLALKQAQGDLVSGSRCATQFSFTIEDDMAQKRGSKRPGPNTAGSKPVPAQPKGSVPVGSGSKGPPVVTPAGAAQMGKGKGKGKK